MICTTRIMGFVHTAASVFERVTGHRTTDHFVAKQSAKLEDAYAWENYRLASGRMNSRKSTFSDVLDPFEVEDGWFVLELAGFQLKPGRHLDESLKAKVRDSIDRLGLNDYDCRERRRRHYEEHREGLIKFAILERYAPQVAMAVRDLK